jgi:hypothetical protein
VHVDAKGTHQIKDIGEAVPMSHWYNGVTPAQESLARTTYQKFLSDVNTKKKEILARPQPGGESNFEGGLVKDEEE